MEQGSNTLAVYVPNVNLKKIVQISCVIIYYYALFLFRIKYEIPLNLYISLYRVLKFRGIRNKILGLFFYIQVQDKTNAGF